MLFSFYWLAPILAPPKKLVLFSAELQPLSILKPASDGFYTAFPICNSLPQEILDFHQWKASGLNILTIYKIIKTKQKISVNQNYQKDHFNLWKWLGIVFIMMK